MPLSYGLALLFDIELDGGTKYVATRDIYSGGQKYLGCVIPGSFSINKKMPNLFYGVAPPSEFTFSMKELQTDSVNASWIQVSAIDEFRGRWVKVQKYNVTDGLVFVAYGRIDSVSFGETIEISTGVNDRSFEKILPVGTVTTSTFATDAIDLGKPINICFGKCRNVPLSNIRWDYENDIYDFLIGYGPIEGIDESITNNMGVHRDDVLCASSLASNGYAIYTGSSWIRGSGGADEAQVYGSHAFIRFFNDQTDWNTRSYTGDIKGLLLSGTVANRSFATCLHALLTNATWGLNDSADSASFVAAGSTLSTANGFFCDGAIVSQESVSGIVDSMLLPMRTFLQRGSDKEWEASVCAASSSVATLGFGDGHYNNIVACGPMVTIPANEIISKITVHYDMEMGRAFSASGDQDRKHFKEIEHTIDADFGVDQVFELRFVKEDDTAKKCVSWITNNMIYSNFTMDLTVDLSGRNIDLNDVVVLDIPIRNLVSNDWIVKSANKNELGNYKLTVAPYHVNLFSDVVLTATTPWDPHYWFSGLTEVPYVTVSPTPGEAMFTTIEAALAKMPSWARRIILLSGTHPAPILTNSYTLPNDRDLEIIGESKRDVIVQNNLEYDLFRIFNGTASYKFSNFTVDCQNLYAFGSGSDMISVTGSSDPENSAKVTIDDVNFNLVNLGDHAVFAMNGDDCDIKIKCETNAGEPIYLFNINNVNITESIFKLSNYNIIARFVNNFSMYGCKILDFKIRGIELSGDVTTQAEDCIIEGNQFISLSSSVTIIEAIYLYYCTRSVARSNQIKIASSDISWVRGIRVKDSSSCGADKNSIFVEQTGGATQYAVGILMTDTSNGNSIEGNNINLVRNLGTYDIALYLGAGVTNCEGSGNIVKNVGVPLFDGGSGNNITGNDEGTPF